MMGVYSIIKERAVFPTITYLVIMGILLFAGTPVIAFSQGPWPMFRHDLKHTARTTYTGPASPVLQWAFAARDAILSSPSIGSDGTIYVGAGWLFGDGTDSSLYAINPDGSLKWKYATDAGVFSSPAVGIDGTIFVASTDQFLYAIEDSVTYGKLRWKTHLGYAFVMGSPTIGPGNNIYIGSADQWFYTINAMDGSIKWNFMSDWCIISSAAIADDSTVYIGSKDHHLYAFRDDLQYYKWAFATGTFYDGHLVDCSPAIGSDGTIYVGTDQYGATGQIPVPVDTAFWAINPNGSLKWAFRVGNGVESSPAIGKDGTIYFGSYDSCLYAVADSGNVGVLKWKFRTKGVVDGSPSVDDEGVIYFGSRDSTIYALLPDGNLKWKYKTGDGIESSPSIDNNGRLYIGSFDGKLYCLGTNAPDVAVVAVNIPPMVHPGNTYIPYVTFRNLRLPPCSFTASCVIDTGGVIVYADTISITNLPADGSKAESFARWAVASDTAKTYRVTLKAILTEDDHQYNNTLSSIAQAADLPILCGDVNSDGTLTLQDVLFLINFLYAGGPPPGPLEAADVNHSRNINLLDILRLVNYLFKGGQALDCQ